MLITPLVDSVSSARRFRMKTPSAVLAAMLTLAGVGCAPPKTIVRFTQATEAQLNAVEDGQTIWYEFQPGDEVPLNIGLIGSAEAVAPNLELVAKRRFFIVVWPYGPPLLSFDGESTVYEGSKTFIAFEKGEAGNTINVLTYLGLPADMPVELQKK